MDKLLVAPRAGQGLRLLCDLGLMRHVVPELLAMRGMRQDIYRYKDVFEHTLHVVDNAERELLLRWAALLHDVGKPRTISLVNGETHFFGHEYVGEGMSRRILNRLRYDKGFVQRVAHLVAMHQRINNYEGDWTDAAVRRFMREAGDALDDLFKLSRADLTTRREDKRRAALRRLAELRERCDAVRAEEDVAKLRAPIDGNDLMALFGRGPGPWIKPIKEHLLDLVVEGALAQDDRAAGERIARELFAQLTAEPEAGGGSRRPGQAATAPPGPAGAAEPKAPAEAGTSEQAAPAAVGAAKPSAGTAAARAGRGGHGGPAGRRRPDAS
jgi:poly(A) polymerase